MKRLVTAILGILLLSGCAENSREAAINNAEVISCTGNTLTVIPAEENTAVTYALSPDALILCNSDLVSAASLTPGDTVAYALLPGGAIGAISIVTDLHTGN